MVSFLLRLSSFQVSEIPNQKSTALYSPKHFGFRTILKDCGAKEGFFRNAHLFFQPHVGARVPHVASAQTI